MVLQEKGHMLVAARLQASLGCAGRKGGGGLYRNGHATGLFKEADKDGGPYGL